MWPRFHFAAATLTASLRCLRGQHRAISDEQRKVRPPDPLGKGAQQKIQVSSQLLSLPLLLIPRRRERPLSSLHICDQCRQDGRLLAEP